MFYKEKLILCPGDVCEVKEKQDIQKTSGLQLLVALAFIAFVFITAFLFNNNFSEKPYDLMGINNTAQNK